MWNYSYRTTSEWWQRTPDVPKSKPISSKWGRARIKTKRETKNFKTGVPSWGKSCEGGEFSHNRKPSHRWGQGELRNLRVKHNEAKMKKIHYRDHAEWQYTAKWLTHLHLPAASGGWVWRHGLHGSVLRERNEVESNKDTLRGLMWHSTGKTLGMPEKQKIIPTGSL